MKFLFGPDTEVNFIVNCAGSEETYECKGQIKPSESAIKLDVPRAAIKSYPITLHGTTKIIDKNESNVWTDAGYPVRWDHSEEKWLISYEYLVFGGLDKKQIDKSDRLKYGMEGATQYFHEFAKSLGVIRDSISEIEDDSRILKCRSGELSIELSFSVDESTQGSTGVEKVSDSSWFDKTKANHRSLSLEREFIPEVELQYDEAKDSHKLLSKIHQIPILFTLLSGLKVRPTNVRLDGNFVQFNTQKELDMTDFRWLPNRFINDKGEAEDVLKNWINTSFSPSINVYYETHGGDLTEIQKLKSYLHAIESAYRNLRDNTYYSDEEFQSVYEEITESVKEIADKDDYIAKMKHGDIKYSNQYSLRKILRELLDEYSLADKYYFGENDINRMVDTRNYYVHYDEVNENVVTDNRKLRNLYRKSRYLLEIMLLDKISNKDSSKIQTSLLETYNISHNE